MAAAPAPVAPAEAAPPPPPEAMGELFTTYNPEGALQGTFAPAYISGYQPSERAVADWAAQNRPVTNANIEGTRMPSAWRDPSASGAGDQYGGGRIPLNLDYTGKGEIDSEALRVLAQGGRYNMGARRDAIAARMLANATAQRMAQPQPLDLTANPYEGML